MSFKIKKIKINKDKKAVMVGQVFIYSLSLFVVALIMIYGYNVISEFIGSSSNVELLQFQKNMEQYVKSYTTEYGSVGFKKVSAPGKVSKLCFTDYYSQSSAIRDCITGSTIVNKVIEDSFSDSPTPRERKNLFLVDNADEVLKSYFLGNISLVPDGGGASACNYLCIESERGVFHIKIVGKGVGVDIADATP